MTIHRVIINNLIKYIHTNTFENLDEMANFEEIINH